MTEKDVFRLFARSSTFNDLFFNSPGHEILTLLLGGFFCHVGAHEQFQFLIASFDIGRVAEIRYGFDLVFKLP